MKTAPCQVRLWNVERECRFVLHCCREGHVTCVDGIASGDCPSLPAGDKLPMPDESIIKIGPIVRRNIPFRGETESLGAATVVVVDCAENLGIGCLDKSEL